MKIMKQPYNSLGASLYKIYSEILKAYKSEDLSNFLPVKEVPKEIEYYNPTELITGTKQLSVLLDNGDILSAYTIHKFFNQLMLAVNSGLEVKDAERSFNNSILGYGEIAIAYDEEK